MDTEIGSRRESPTTAGSAGGVALLLGSALSNQTGAAVGAMAFDAIGPVGVVAVRQWVAGIALVLLGRPRLRAFTRRQWWPVLGLAVVFGTMNVSLYSAIDRVGLGLAVTMEFLGPLAVAVMGARRRATLGCVVLAAVGVVVLTRPQPSSDYLGIALGLLAAACWSAYILLNRTVGRRVPGVEGSAAASAVSALAYVPIGVAVLLAHPPTPNALACAATAGLLASTVPFVVDLLALRRIPAHFFGIFMSVHPVFAAAIGAVVLGEALALLDWLGIALVVTANAAAVLIASDARRPRDVLTPGAVPHPPAGRAGRRRP